METLADLFESARVPLHGNDAEKCPRCGTAVRIEAATCVRCLLDQAPDGEEEVSHEDFLRRLQEAAVPDVEWQLGNYEVLGEIARGGMGVIYRARQRHSRRVVAVKRILSYHAQNRDWMQRFRRETELTGSLDHPNILPIYEISESADGVPYFSMKLAAGGSLRDAGPELAKDPRECVRIMAKVARAIDYAHKHGILHRDLQPGNVLLDGEGEPMVGDFGLAKWLDGASDLTRTLTTFGTPGYIAPEQAKGPAAELKPAADIYSLGAMLFNLLAGRPPFVGPNALAVLSEAANSDAPKLRSVRPEIDRNLETICARCLEREPQARYHTAGDLAVDLESWLDGRPIIARRVSTLGRLWRWAKRNRTSAITVAAASCVVVGSAVLFSLLSPQPLSAPSEKSLAVLPFENLSKNTSDAYLAVGIQDAVLTRLAKIGALKVIARTSTEQYAAGPRNVAAIARELGAANLLQGSVQKDGDSLRVNVQLIRGATAEGLWAESYDRKLTNVLDVETEVATAVADALNTRLTDSEQAAVRQKPTNNPEAYDAYLRGLSFEARSMSAFEAANSYERAVQLDPNFAPAWAKLSRANADLYSDQRDASAARSDAARNALENAQRLQPDAPETLLALGYYQYGVLHDNSAAKTTFRRVSKLLPHNMEVPAALAEIDRFEGEWDQSIAYYEEALVLDPRNAELLREAAMTYAMVRRFPTALKLYDRALEIIPNDPELITAKAGVYECQGNLLQAGGLLSQIDWQTPSDAAVRAKIYHLRLARNYDEAVRLLQTRLSQFHIDSEFQKTSEQMMLAEMEGLAGDSAGAKITAGEARRTLERLYGDQPDNAWVAATLAGAYATLGDKDLALSTSEHAVELSHSAKNRMTEPVLGRALAQIQAAFGETNRPIATLSRLLQTPGLITGLDPITPAILRLDPVWDPLRSDPRFEKLLEETGRPIEPK